MSLVERLIFQYTNDYRVKHQRNPLKKADSWIVRGNEQRAKEMADYGYLSYVDPKTGKEKAHRRPDGSYFFTAYEDSNVGENIQQSYMPKSGSEEELAQRMFNNWAKSPAHSANMLNEYHGSLDVKVYSIDKVREGTEYAKSADYYTYVIGTQAFGGEPQESTTTLNDTDDYNVDQEYTTVIDNTNDSTETFQEESTIEVESTTQP